MLDMFLSHETADMVLGCALGSVGSIVKHARDVNENDDAFFCTQNILVHVVMGCGVGMAMSSFLEQDVLYRNGLIIMFGFMASPLLDIIDKRSKQIIRRVLGRKLSIL